MYALDIVWDPSKGISLTDSFMIHYYSLMWIVAFFIGHYVMKKIYKKESINEEKLDSLFMYTILGTIIGARLGHVIFYQPELFREDFLSVFLPFRFNPVFEFTGFRGLASHGAAIGILFSMYLYNKKILKKNILWILDRLVVAVSIGAVFIRFGNFINSEIIGHKTDSVFGVVFKALDHTEPRHPAQLYEAFGYLIVFIIVYLTYWKTSKASKPGYLFGLFFILLWTTRFIVEFFKEAQVAGREDWILGMNTGQALSIPFILLGIYFMFRK